MHTFRAAAEANDPDALVASLADDIVFQSPAVFTPYRGREAVGTLLRSVMRVFEDFRYVDELASAEQTALVFTARVGGKQIDGIDLGRVNAAGLVTHLTVFIRPLSGLMALAQAMQAQLAAGPRP